MWAVQDAVLAGLPRDSMKSKNRWHSFICAVNGLVYTLRTQRNTRIELAATVAVIIAGVWLDIRPVEWALLALTVGMIWHWKRSTAPSRR